MGRLFRSSSSVGRGVGLDRVFEAVDLHGAGGHNQVLRAIGVDHVGRRESLGLQRVQDRGPPGSGAACRRRETASARLRWWPAGCGWCLVPRSFNCCSFRPWPESPSCSTGTLEALYWMMNGGVVPGGSERNCTWLMAVTCATAWPMFTCGWKKILMSRCRRSDLRLDVLDVVDRRGHAALAVEDDAVGHLLRGEAGEVPTTVTTGISMLGKMSVGIDSMLKTPRIRIRSAKTTKV